VDTWPKPGGLVLGLAAELPGTSLVPRTRTVTTKFCCFGSYCLEHFAINPACIDHYARTVSEWSKDNTVSFGLRDMIRRFRDCLGR